MRLDEELCGWRGRKWNLSNGGKDFSLDLLENVLAQICK